MDENIKWVNEKRKLGELIPYEHNPRTLSKKTATRLKKSLKNTGYAEVVAINTDNVIVAGHQRVNILKTLNNDDVEIDVRVPERTLTDKEFKDYLVASNKDTGDWDYDILASMFEVDELIEKGFDPKELGVDLDDDEEAKDESDQISEGWQIIIDCKDEKEQIKYIEQFEELNIPCRPITL